MEPPPKPSSTSFFQVYLRLRPPPPVPSTTYTTPQSLYPTLPTTERYLTVEALEESENGMPTHITITPPVESRRRAVEKFAFTKVFEEEATQLDIFKGTGVIPLIEDVLGPDGRDGRDGLIATLGVTGSGKSHTILGSRSQRGLTQLSLDVIFNSLGSHLLHPSTNLSLCSSLSGSDVSEAQLLPASIFLDSLYGEAETSMLSRASSRAPTPMVMVGDEALLHTCPLGFYPSLPRLNPRGHAPRRDQRNGHAIPLNVCRVTRSQAKKRNELTKDGAYATMSRRRQPPCTSALPQLPDVSNIELCSDDESDYAIVVSMYEVYNDRIFDLLTPQSSTHSSSSKAGQQKDRRRALLFKSTEKSPDRKVVAGLRKVICGDLNEALMVLETGLYERRVAGTGSNSVSSRSHGFFCVEVKKRNRASPRAWSGSTLTIVDLAGSERARNANTAGTTLAEAGKINESLMYLGQCLQMQSDNSIISNKPALVPFRQCKLTELLFSNSFPSASVTSHNHTSSSRNAQKSVMIVTADPLGDFNATSQILRYSALAREITVPRVPSTSTTMSGTTANKSNLTSGRTTPSSCSVEELEYAALEIARLTEELHVMGLRLTDEELRRREMENAWKSAEERCELVEQEAREECWIEMERRIEEERLRWKGAWGEEADRNDEHLDKKLDILTRTIQIHEDPEPSSREHTEELEDENEMLRRKVDLLERELRNRSPTKKQKGLPIPRKLRLGDEELENAVQGLSEMKLGDPSESGLNSKTPAKKQQRKLTTRKWDVGMDASSP
ncbi:MAG: hypothetical protein M1813_008301 [Trichoglossum hirsutum]|nr:MAG: hypothetical protein M1813_008301 [Trichoglossum hirsutum]